MQSFFGRSYNNLSSISECKNNGKCIIDKKNRTTCKACRLRKCYMVGMSKSGSRYGRRSNWFKIHCLLQEQQQQQQQQQQQPQHTQQTQQSTASIDNNNVKNFMGGVMGMGYPGIAGYAAPAFAPPAQPAAHAHNQAELMAAAMPFFRLMHSTEALSHGHFAMPPTQLLFCPEAMAAYHQRRSVDSTASSESPRRFSPYVTTAQTRLTVTPTATIQSGITQTQTPELCVYSSADEEEEEHLSVSCNSPLPTPTINAVTPPISQNSPAPASLFISHVFPSPVSSLNLTQSPKTLAPPTNINTDACDNTTLDERLSFSHKIQSLSPVSVCSISAEYQNSHTSSASTGNVAAATQSYEYQEAPIDLSMKTSTSVNKKDASPRPVEQQQAATEHHVKHDSNYFASPVEDNCSSHANSTPELVENGSEQQTEFRQLTENNKLAFSGFTPLNNTSLRGIFVCV